MIVPFHLLYTVGILEEISMWRPNQRGIALISTLGVGLALVVLGLLLFAFVRIEGDLTKKSVTQSQAFWQAEAGLHMAHWWLRYTDELKNDVTDKSIVIKNDFLPSSGNKLLLTKTTEGVYKEGLKITLLSKSSVHTGVRQGETKEQTLKEEVLLTLPGSLGHGVAIATSMEIYYVDVQCGHGWQETGWHHETNGNGCYHHYCQNTGDLAQVYGEVEIGNIDLPSGLFDSLVAFKDYFKGRQMVIYNGDQSFYDGIIPKDKEGNDIKLIFVDGDIHLYGNWSNKNITFVATGSIYLDTQVEKGGKCGCKEKNYEPVTTGDTGRLTLIAYNTAYDTNPDHPGVVIIGTNSSNINGIICCRGDVELKGVDKHGCGCWHCHKTDPSGGTFKGTILAKGKVKLGVNWTIYYDAQVITGSIVEPNLGLSYGFNYDLKRLSWSEL